MSDQASSRRLQRAKADYPPSFAFIGGEGSGVSTLVGELAASLALRGGRPLLIEHQPGHQQAGGDQGRGRQSHACIIPEFGIQTASSPICTSAACYALRRPYFRLMVVFTPWLVVESSNQRAVTVLVWV